MNVQMLPWNWSFDAPVLLGLAIAILLYAGGLKYSLESGLIRQVPVWRSLSYSAGLAVIFLALESPIDGWSDTYLWAHMIQHELLIFIAPPLVLLGAPFWQVWRAIPLEARRSTLRWALQHPRPRRVALAVGHLLFNSRFVWWLFVLDFYAWHIPVFYDLALTYQPIHDAEHLCFLMTGLLFWAQIIPSHPLKPRLGYLSQAFYVFGIAIAMEVVTLAYVIATQPIYPYYANHARAAGALSPIVDQASAGGLMMLATMIIFGTTFMTLLWWWLADDEKRSETLTEPTHRAHSPSALT